MYIKGVGMTRFSYEDRTSFSMAHKAVAEALNDSDTKMNEIDGIVLSTVDSTVSSEKQRHYSSALASLLKTKVPIIRVPAVCGGGGAALWTANRMGFDNCLVVAVDKILENTTKVVTKEIMSANDNVWEQMEGVTFPTQNALMAQQHMVKFGSTMEDLALISFKNHNNAFHNKKACFYGKKVSIETIKNSPVVSSPFRLYDCTVSVNGASACILSKDKTDVKLAGSGFSVDYISPFDREDLTTWQATVISSRQAYNQAGIEPADIDVAEIHDAFTIIELMSYEDLGFCKKGEGQNLIRDGITELDGKLPVNTGGGLKARGHPISPTGLAQTYEIVNQLRGKSGDVQVQDAKIGLSQNIGGAGGSISTHIYKKISG